MCVVSMVSDYYNDDNFKPKYPQYPMPWPSNAPPSLPWTKESFELLQDIMEKMKQLDEKLGLANCEDPKKKKWMAAIEKRLKRLERKKVKS